MAVPKQTLEECQARGWYYVPKLDSQFWLTRQMFHWAQQQDQPDVRVELRTRYAQVSSDFISTHFRHASTAYQERVKQIFLRHMKPEMRRYPVNLGGYGSYGYFSYYRYVLIEEAAQCADELVAAYRQLLTSPEEVAEAEHD